MKILSKAYLIGAICLVMFACTSTAEETSTQAGKSESQKRDPLVVTSISPKQMKVILQSEGFVNIKFDEDDDLVVKMHGWDVAIIFSSDNKAFHMRLYLTGSDAGLSEVNKWNTEMLHTKACISEQGGVGLEMDVDVSEGVTISHIKNHVMFYYRELATFLNEVVD